MAMKDATEGNKNLSELGDITKLRCLLVDFLFPLNKAQWRLVEIHSFIEKYDTDILVEYNGDEIFHDEVYPTHGGLASPEYIFLG